MKKRIKSLCLPVLMLVCFLAFGGSVRAQGEDTIRTGVYAGEINLSGMTQDQASAAVEAFVDDLKEVEIGLVAAGGNQVTVTAGELGVAWSNPELVTEAAELGTRGNVIERYKMLKDLEYENKVFPIELSFDLQAINNILAEKCEPYNTEAVDASLVRENGTFRVVEGQIGYLLDVETSIDKINDYLTQEWNYEPCSIELDVAVDEPRGSAEELAAVQDLLGSCTTSYTTSKGARTWKTAARSSTESPYIPARSSLPAMWSLPSRRRTVTIWRVLT